MSNPLKEKHCVPCEGDADPLTKQESERLRAHVEEWQMNDDVSIEKTIVFSDFKEALSFVNKVGTIAEQEGHHPDIRLHDYKKVTLTLSTHAIKGLSENDFILAAKIDELRRA